MNLLAVVFILLNQWSAKQSIQMFDHEELVRNTWPWAYTAICVSCGYFAYDQWDMLKYGLYSGWFPSILAHHLILLVCFTHALYRYVTINYLILTLICEVIFDISYVCLSCKIHMCSYLRNDKLLNVMQSLPNSS